MAWTPVRNAAAFLLIGCVLGAAPERSSAAELPPQGVYDSCAPATSATGCRARVERVGAAGFKAIANGSLLNGTERQVMAFLAAAQASGVKVVWPINSSDWWTADPHGSSMLAGYPLLAATCRCIDNAGFLRYIVGIARDHPATWGYYIADEPKADLRAQVDAYTARVKALDPHHPRLIVACGICNGGPEKWIAPYGDADATLATDSYPVWWPSIGDDYVRSQVEETAGALQRIADRRGRDTAMVLQAWNWGDSYHDARGAGVDPATTRFPSAAQIELQRNAALARSRPKLILWFTLHSVLGWEPGQRPWYWAQPPDPERRWANLVKGAFAPLPNVRPVTRMTVRRRRASRGRWRVSARARASDRDGQIVRYRWTWNGRKVRSCRRAKCTLRKRKPGRHVLRLTVTDDRGGTAKRARRMVLRRKR